MLCERFDGGMQLISVQCRQMTQTACSPMVEPSRLTCTPLDDVTQRGVDLTCGLKVVTIIIQHVNVR